MGYVQVQFAIDDREKADEIIESLLTGHLVACGQRMGPMVSRYWWNGSLDQAQEWLVLVKTRSELASKVTDAIVQSHPYETPEVLTFAIDDGCPRYLAWIGSATSPPAL